jgi:hypothetical protein
MVSRSARLAAEMQLNEGTHMRLSSRLAIAAAGLILVSTACSSSSENKSNESAATTAPTSVAAVAAAATETPATATTATAAASAPTSAVHIATGTASAGGGGTLGGAGNTATATARAADAVVAPDCFQSVSAFKYDLTLKIDVKQNGTATPDATLDLASLLGNIHVNGQFQAPDRTEAKFQFLGQAYDTIAIGSDTWTKQGNGPWQKGDASDNIAASLTPSDLCQQALTGLSATGVKPTSEKLNGQSVLKYEFDHDALSKFQDLFGPSGEGGDTPIPADAKLDIWVTEKEHLPVKMMLQGSDTSDQGSYTIDLEFNITDLNGEDINIQPPQ